jgi:hypothetical protein
MISTFIKDLGIANLRCPVQKETVIKITNYTDSKETSSLLKVPPGSYRTSVLLYNDFDEKVFQLRVFFFVKAGWDQNYEFK